jgi:transcriptional regulator with GAF, ATPase, and Fis domain
VANQLAIAISNARMFESEQRRIKQLSDINRLSIALTAQFIAPSNLQRIIAAVAQIFQVEQAAMILFGPQPTDTIVALSGQSSPNDAELRQLLQRHPYLAAKIARLNQPRYVRLAEHSDLTPLQAFFAARRLETVLLVPLKVKQHTQGVICLDVSQREPLQQAELELTTTVASLIVQIWEIVVSTGLSMMSARPSMPFCKVRPTRSCSLTQNGACCWQIRLRNIDCRSIRKRTVGRLSINCQPYKQSSPSWPVLSQRLSR